MTRFTNYYIPFRYEPPYYYPPYDECDCDDRCPLCGKKKRKYPRYNWRVEGWKGTVKVNARYE